MLQRLAMLLPMAGLLMAVACSQSDPGITTAVKAKLAADDTVKAYQIDVDTADGVVTLNGTVETGAAETQALTLARGTDGVRDVVDEITVNAAAAPNPDNAAAEARDEARDAAASADRATDRAQGTAGDAAITSAVKSKLLADTTVAGLKIDVDTNGGVVTLSGRAGTQAESDRAASLARDTTGVSRVVNNLKIGR